MAANVHVERGRQIADALDSSDRDQTLAEQYVAEWKAWEAEDPTRTMRAYDRAIGRANDYTGKIVRAVTTGARRAPFGGEKAQQSRDRHKAKRTLADPKQRKAVISSQTVEEKAAVFEEYASDPEVVGAAVARKGKVAKVVAKAVEDAEDREAKQRIQKAKQRAEQTKRPTPLSQFFWRIVGEMRKWSRDVRTIREELGTLDPAQLDQVVEAHRALVAELQANLDLLTDSEPVESDIIEGTARDRRHELVA